MILTNPNYTTYPLSSKNGGYPTVYEFHRVVVDAAKLGAKLITQAQALAGTSERESVLARMGQATQRVIAQAAESIATRVMTAWRAQNLDGVRARRARTSGVAVQVDDWLTCYLAGPTLSAPVAMTTATDRSGERIIYPVSAPRSMLKCYSEFAAGGVAVINPLTALLSAEMSIYYAELHRLSDAQANDVEMIRSQTQALRDSTAWVDLLKPIDFIAFTDDGIIVPRGWNDAIYGVLPGVTRYAPTESGLSGVVSELEDKAEAASQVLAAGLNVTAAELQSMREGTRAGRRLTEEAAWTLLPYETTEEVTLDNATATYLLRQPQAWLALVAEVVRQMEGVIAYTPESYASTIYRVSQACNKALDQQIWTASWSTRINRDPMTVQEVHGLLHRAGGVGWMSPAEQSGAVGALVAIIRGDYQWESGNSLGTLTPFELSLIDQWMGEPLPILSELAVRLHGSCTLLDSATYRVTWSQGAKSITLSLKQLSGLSLLPAVLDDLASVTTAQAARAFDAYVCERRVLAFIVALASTTSKDALVLDESAGTLKLLSKSAILLASRNAGLAVGDASLASPFLLKRDNPEVD